MSKLLKLLEPLRHAAFTEKVNKLMIPVTIFNQDKDGKNAWNSIYKELLKDKSYSIIKRTKSGGISLKRKLSEGYNQYDVQQSTSCLELTIINIEGMWRIQFRHEQREVKIKGRRAFTQFKRMCEECGIKLDDYAVHNGREIKEEIEKPLIKLEHVVYRDMIFENAHHIDYHSSYPAGLVNTHPEFKDVVEKCYSLRNHNDFYKAILNYSIGFMQSKGGCNARYAELSRDAIADNNKRIIDLADRLDKSGRTVIAYNVDGIWYTGTVYHGDGEGHNLGLWENDHIGCKLRYKSDGAYEYIENGQYHPVVRGMTRLDNIKSRDKWEWGDIYQDDCEIIHYYFLEGEGIIDEQDQIRLLQRAIEETSTSL